MSAYETSCLSCIPVQISGCTTAFSLPVTRLVVRKPFVPCVSFPGNGQEKAPRGGGRSREKQETENWGGHGNCGGWY